MTRAAALFFFICASTGAATVALVLDSRELERDSAGTREFHRLVGGVGFGPAVEPDRCEFGFDPRLCPACANDVGPIPGGLFFCPQHASSIFDYSSPAEGPPTDAPRP